MKSFAQRRMGVDGERDVFEARAHFQRQRKGGRKLRDALPDRLHAQHDMIVRARDDAHETLVVLQRHGAAVGAERKMSDSNFAMRRFGGVGRQSDADDLGIGKADRRNCDMIKGALLPGDDLGDHFALRHRAVGEHRFAGHVADRPDVAHRRRASRVDT